MRMMIKKTILIHYKTVWGEDNVDERIIEGDDLLENLVKIIIDNGFVRDFGENKSAYIPPHRILGIYWEND